MRKRFLGFTMSEILITLGVIGVVALVSVPVFVEKVTDKSLERAKADTYTKLKEATNQMGMNNVLVGYTTNEAFTNEFQKYMKVTNRCDSSNLSKCFPAKIKTSDGTEIDASALILASDLQAGNNAAPTVGLGLANGTAIILGLKSLTGAADDPCIKLDPMSSDPTIANTLSCVSMLYDVNGFRGPNTIGKDVFTDINATKFVCTGVKVGNLCIAGADAAVTAINTCSTGTAEDQAFDLTGDSNTVCATNHWAGAKKACAAQGMRMPNQGELNLIYANRATLGTFDTNHLYWSTYAYDATQVFPINFSTGGWSYTNSKNTPNNVRCVK